MNKKAMTDMNKKTMKSNTKQPGGRQLSLLICCALSVVCLACTGRAHAAKFEIIALPDTENYVDPPENAWVMTNQTQWIVDQKTTENIVFDPDAKTISVKTFSPTYTAIPWLTDEYHQYSYPAEFLRQVDGVASRPIGVATPTGTPFDGQ